MYRTRYVLACIAAALVVLLSACTPAGHLDRLPTAGEGQSPLNSGTAVFVHPAWGITLHYPSGWTADIPDFEKLAQPPAEGVAEGYTYNPDVESMRLQGHVITLSAPTQDGAMVPMLVVGLDSYTISAGTSLQTWVDLRQQLDAVENPLAAETTVTTRAVAGLPFTHAADQVAYTVLDNRLIHTETIWLAKGGLVFAIHAASSDPKLLKQMFSIAATIEFDADKLAAMRAQPVFAGDEQAIEATVERLQPHAEPACDIVCRDQKALEQIPTVTPVGATP